MRKKKDGTLRAAAPRCFLPRAGIRGAPQHACMIRRSDKVEHRGEAGRSIGGFHPCPVQRWPERSVARPSTGSSADGWRGTLEASEVRMSNEDQWKAVDTY